MKRLLLLILNVLLISAPAFATTYYAATGGGGAASCVDNGANVCTISRAVTVASTGTHTIEMAAGTYTFTTALAFASTSTGANLTIQPATGAAVTFTTNGTDEVLDIQAAMVSGSLTFKNFTVSDTGADRCIDNVAPQVSLILDGMTIVNSDATAGTGIRFSEDTTNQIEYVTGNDTSTALRTGATTNVKIAQKITVGGSNITVSSLGLFLTKSGLIPSGKNLVATIETDNSGAPSGTPATNGTSDNYPAAEVKAVGYFHNFNFATNVTLTASTVYWIVLSGDYDVSTTNYISWAVDSTSGGYADGNGFTYDATNWTEQSDYDYMFSLNLRHTRDLTITNSTFTTRTSNVAVVNVDDVNISGSTLTVTEDTGQINSISVSGAVESGLAADSVELSNNVFSNASDNGLLFSNAATTEKSYINKLVLYGNTGSVPALINVNEGLRRLLILDNELDLTYAGNPVVILGHEVDGSGNASVSDMPFEQIVIEGNYLHYTAASHNHMILLAIGAERGVLRNNTIFAEGTGGAWGIILKAIGWVLHGNLVRAAGPAIYVSGTNNSTIINNTFESYGGDSACLFRTHQDSEYGYEDNLQGTPFHNYFVDNICISNGAYEAVEYCDHSSCNTASSLGTYRDLKEWSNRIDNNIYYARGQATQVTMAAGSTAEAVTVAEGVGTMRTTWQSSSYTNDGSISDYNDLKNSYIGDVGIDTSTTSFKTSSSNVKNKGTVENTSIGGYQSSGGRKWIGSSSSRS